MKPNMKKNNKNEFNMNELSIDEMDQVSGGSVIAAIGLGAACVCLVVEGVKFGRKIYRDLTSD